MLRRTVFPLSSLVDDIPDDKMAPSYAEKALSYDELLAKCSLAQAAREGNIEHVRLVLRFPQGQFYASSNKNLALREAAGKGHIEILNLLLTLPNVLKDADVNENEILQWAAYCGQCASLYRLLKISTVMDEIAINQNLALRNAVKNGKFDACRFLLQFISVRNEVDAEDNEAFREACKNGDEAIVRLLLNYSVVKKNITAKKCEALRNAATNGHLSIVQLLLEDETVREHATDDFNGALRGAAKNGHTKIVLCLLALTKVRKHAAAMDNYAFNWAARNGHVEIVNLLLQLPCVLFNASSINNYALRWSVKMSKYDISRYAKIIGQLLQIPSVRDPDQSFDQNFAHSISKVAREINLRIDISQNLLPAIPPQNLHDIILDYLEYKPLSHMSTYKRRKTDLSNAELKKLLAYYKKHTPSRNIKKAIQDAQHEQLLQLSILDEFPAHPEIKMSCFSAQHAASSTASTTLTCAGLKAPLVFSSATHTLKSASSGSHVAAPSREPVKITRKKPRSRGCKTQNKQAAGLHQSSLMVPASKSTESQTTPLVFSDVTSSSSSLAQSQSSAVSSRSTNPQAVIQAGNQDNRSRSQQQNKTARIHRSTETTQVLESNNALHGLCTQLQKFKVRN